MKKFILLVSLGIVLTSTAFASQFSDMSENHWAYSKIAVMQEKGIIDGFEDGTFRPEEKVSREQFAKLLVKTFNLKSNTQRSIFKDVDANRWSANDINVASEYLTGYSYNGDLYFRPEEDSVREDVAVAVVKAEGLENNTPKLELLDNFTDKDEISSNLKGYVALAVEYGIMKGNADGTFNPLGTLTRAEAVTLLSNALEIEKVPVVSPEKDKECNHVFKTSYEDINDDTHTERKWCVKCMDEKYETVKVVKHTYDRNGVCECGYERKTVIIDDVDKDMLDLVVKKLDIMGMYSDNTFKPENKITRAEATKMVVCLLNESTAAEINFKNGNRPSFDDLKNINHWANGYIYVAAQHGLFSTDKSNFYPEENITNRDFLEMVVNALGYRNQVLSSNSGYVEYANNLGLLKGIASINSNAEITRGDALKILYNALNSNMWDVKENSDGSVGYGKTEKTLLEIKFPNK